MPDEVTIHEAKTHLSRLVARANAGEDIVIRRGSVPMARLTRYEAPVRTREPGRLRGLIVADELDTDEAYGDELGDLFGLPR